MTKACPCTSGREYLACCRPFHRGEREAPDAAALMRSRFAAFALRDAPYLWRTLHVTHPDRARPEADVLRELKAAAWKYRYRSLDVLDAAPARVLFFAHVFESGVDRSFIERSDFAHDGAGWRYVGGVFVPREAWPRDPLALRLGDADGLVDLKPGHGNR